MKSEHLSSAMKTSINGHDRVSRLQDSKECPGARLKTNFQDWPFTMGKINPSVHCKTQKRGKGKDTARIKREKEKRKVLVNGIKRATVQVATMAYVRSTHLEYGVLGM